MSDTQEDPRIAAMVERMKSFTRETLAILETLPPNAPRVAPSIEDAIVVMLAAADAVDPLRQQRDPDEGSKPSLPIKAEVFSDDLHLSVKFDAAPYFAAAENQDILNLADCEFRGDTAADDVARYMSTLPGRSDIQAVLFYAAEVPDMGFECHIDLHDALEWIKLNRQDVFADVMAILQANRTIRVVKTSQELRSWFNTLSDNIKTANQISIVLSEDAKIPSEDVVFVKAEIFAIVGTSDGQFYVGPSYGRTAGVRSGSYTSTCDEALGLAITWYGLMSSIGIPRCDNPPVYSTTR